LSNSGDISPPEEGKAGRKQRSCEKCRLLNGYRQPKPEILYADP
jgi:hypothetical protein